MRTPRPPGQRPASPSPRRGADAPRQRDSTGPKNERAPRPMEGSERPIIPKALKSSRPLRSKPPVGKSPGAKPEPRISIPDPNEPLRIAKAMARAGLCSRREAERWIEDGRVSVNGKTLRTPAFEVTPRDRVLVDGQLLPASEPTRLWRYFKPRGLVTSHSDPQGRPTVFENLPEDLPRVVSVGRLDFNTEGLLLLTNDGHLARYLELPDTGWLRRYRVRAHGRVTQAELDKLQDGVEVEGVRYGPVEATVDSVAGGNVWLTVGIREGKNREVRKVLSKFQLDVNRLIRISFGPFQVAELQPGQAEVVRRHVLADQLGRDVAERFGLAGATDDERARRQSRKRD